MRDLRYGLLMTTVALTLTASGCIIPGRIVEFERFQGLAADSKTGAGVAGVTVHAARVQDGVEHELVVETTDEHGEFIVDIDYDYGVTLFFGLTIPPTTPDPTDVVLHLTKDGYEPLNVGWLEGKWWTMQKAPDGAYVRTGGVPLGDGGRTRTGIYDFDHGRIPYHKVFLFSIPIIRMKAAE